MSELTETPQSILDDKNINLTPENLRQGVTCLGVEGSLSSGSGISIDEYGNEWVETAKDDIVIDQDGNPRVQNGPYIDYSITFNLDNYKTLQIPVEVINNVDSNFIFNIHLSNISIYKYDNTDILNLCGNQYLEMSSPTDSGNNVNPTIEYNTVYANIEFYDENNSIIPELSSDFLFSLAFTGIGSMNSQYYQLYISITQLEVKTTISKYEMDIQSLKSCISRVKKVNYLINQVDRR